MTRKSIPRRAAETLALWGTAIVIGLSLLPEFFSKKRIGG